MRYNEVDIGIEEGTPPMALPKHVRAIVVESHSTRRAHQVGLSFKCDVCGCKIKGGAQVVRALSREWSVSNKKGKLTSQIVLAEVRVSDYPTLKEAKAALAQMVSVRKELTVPVLNKMKRPLECGYTEDEVMRVIMPYVMKLARKYKSNLFEEGEGVSQAFLGLRQALECDRARAPFGTYAYQHLQTKIRRKSMGSGVIKHGERDCDLHGIQGVQNELFEEV